MLSRPVHTRLCLVITLLALSTLYGPKVAAATPAVPQQVGSPTDTVTIPANMSIGATSWGRGRIDLFAPGANNQMYHYTYDNSAWIQGWERQPSQTTSGSAASSRGNGILDVFWRGQDGNLWHKFYNGSWSGNENLNVAIVSAPASVAHGSKVEVFYEMAGNKLGYTTWDGSWHSFPANQEIVGQPAVAARSASLYDVFWKDKAGSLKHMSNQDGTWSAASAVGPTITSDPAAVSWGGGRLDVFYGVSGEKMGHTFWNGAWGSDTVDMRGATFGSAPSVASWESGRLDLFLRSATGAVQHKAYNGNWNAWETLDQSTQVTVGYDGYVVDLVAIDSTIGQNCPNDKYWIVGTSANTKTPQDWNSGTKGGHKIYMCVLYGDRDKAINHIALQIDYANAKPGCSFGTTGSMDLNSGAGGATLRLCAGKDSAYNHGIYPTTGIKSVVGYAAPAGTLLCPGGAGVTVFEDTRGNYNTANKIGNALLDASTSPDGGVPGDFNWGSGGDFLLMCVVR